MERKTPKEVVIFLVVASSVIFTSGFFAGIAAGYGVWGANRRNITNERAVDASGRIINELARDQQTAVDGVETVTGIVSDLADGIERSIGYLERTENRIGSATGISRDLTSGIDRSILLVETSGEQLTELEYIIRELYKRTGITEDTDD